MTAGQGRDGYRTSRVYRGRLPVKVRVMGDLLRGSPDNGERSNKERQTTTQHFAE
jgi:hypothetical protein